MTLFLWNLCDACRADEGKHLAAIETDCLQSHNVSGFSVEDASAGFEAVRA
jgi:hypothetical protein